MFYVDGQTDRQMGGQRDRQTDQPTGMTKLIVTFLNFAKEHKN